MRVKKEGYVWTYIYSGDLQKEVDKTYRELQRKQNDKKILQAIADKANKELQSCLNRIESIEGFHRAAEKEGILPKGGKNEDI